MQRVMENLQVYRARFGGSTKLLIEADFAGAGRGELIRSAHRSARRFVFSCRAWQAA